MSDIHETNQDPTKENVAGVNKPAGNGKGPKAGLGDASPAAQASNGNGQAAASTKARKAEGSVQTAPSARSRQKSCRNSKRR